MVMIKRVLCVLAVAIGAAMAGSNSAQRRSGIRGSVHNNKMISSSIPVNVLERRTLPRRQLDHYNDNSGYPLDGDSDRRPCTYYYGDTRKSKFNGYDDDWYDDCKTSSSNNGPPSQQNAQVATPGVAPTPFPTLPPTMLKV